MSLREFRHWAALYAKEPWGEAAADLRAAKIAQACWRAAGVEIPIGTIMPADPWKTTTPAAAMTDDEIKEAFMRCDAML